MLDYRLRVIAGVILALAYAASGWAATGIDWPSLSDTVIRTVAKPLDMPTPVAPLTFAQDGAGFIWAGGDSGLLRWDGYEFRAYTAGGRQDDGLRDHYVWVVHTDRDGRLWAGTAAGGLARYDPTTDRFRPVVLADQRGDATRVMSLDDDDAGGLWVGTNRGIAHLDAQGRTLPPKQQLKSASMVFSLPSWNVEALARGRQGALWLGGVNGLARMSADGNVVPIALPTVDGTTPDVSHLMQDSAGRIWVGTRHHGAYAIDSVSLHARSVLMPGAVKAPEGGLEIMATEEVEPGRIWLGTFGYGIVDVDADSMTARSIMRDPVVPGTLDSNLVYALHRDRSGITWIGTTAGIDQYVPPLAGIHTLFANSLHHNWVPNDVVAVLPRRDGSVWLGSEMNGIVVLGADGKLIKTLPIARVFCLVSDQAGQVYIGARGGLFVANASGDSVRKIEIVSRRPNAGVLSLAVVDGTVWLGGIDDGLWELHPAESGPFHVASHVSAPPLPDSAIYALAPAPGARLAVGTGNGMALLDRTSGELEKIISDPANAKGLAPGAIQSFLTDRRQRLWVSASGNGIDIMLGRDEAGRPTFRRITAADGLPNTDASLVTLDGQGLAWVSTDTGLASIDPDSFTVRAYRQADGVAIATYWAASGGRVQNGDLLFGGMGGLTVVEPGRLQGWGYRPPVAISEIHVGGRVVRDRTSELQVLPRANSLAVEFAALDFSDPGRNEYRYQLEGFDPDYIITDSKHRVASYTHLPPGRYTLRLQGSNREGVWSAPATIAVHVLPAWFQTLTFRILEAVALLLAGGALVQGRTAWLRRRQIYLENLVAERTVALTASQQKLTQLAYFDSLTALPNRRSFNQSIEELLDLALNSSYKFVLILIDLDGFKRVNDTLGHDAGDQVLIVAAACLRGALREGDCVARLGGDEFAILLPKMNDPEVVKLVCDRVVMGMTAPIEINGKLVSIGASVGVALCPRDGRTAEELYKRADQALYQAKRAGKGVWCWYREPPPETSIFPADAQI